MEPTHAILPRPIRRTVELDGSTPSSLIFDVGAIDLFYALPTGDDIEAVFYRGNTGTSSYSDQSEPFGLVAGQAFSLDQGELSAWSGVQLRLAAGSTSSSIDLILNSRGS